MNLVKSTALEIQNDISIMASHLKIRDTISNYSTRSEYKYGIKKVTRGEQVDHIPVVKEPGMFTSWRPIVKVYNEYLIIDHEARGLSYDECINHIEGYKAQLEKFRNANVIQTIILKYEEKL